MNKNRTAIALLIAICCACRGADVAELPSLDYGKTVLEVPPSKPGEGDFAAQNWRSVTNRCLEGLNRSVERKKVLLHLQRKTLWPVEGGVFMEVVHANGEGYGSVLVSTAGNVVKVYDFKDDVWLVVQRDEPLLGNLTDKNIEALKNDANWRVEDSDCYFIAIVSSVGAVKRSVYIGSRSGAAPVPTTIIDVLSQYLRASQ